MKMSGNDSNRLKWQIIETVCEYLHEYLGEDAERLERQFTSTYESVLETPNSDSHLHLLIREFKPTLSAILLPGKHFDRLMGLISPILNDALSYNMFTNNKKIRYLISLFNKLNKVFLI